MSLQASLFNTELDLRNLQVKVVNQGISEIFNSSFSTEVSDVDVKRVVIIINPFFVIK